MKAKFVEKYYLLGNAVLVYEYKGYKYDVTDYGWKGGEPLSWQHKNEQAHIDELIARENRKTNYVEEPAQIGLDMFFESVGL